MAVVLIVVETLLNFFETRWYQESQEISIFVGIKLCLFDAIQSLNADSVVPAA